MFRRKRKRWAGTVIEPPSVRVCPESIVKLPASGVPAVPISIDEESLA